MRPSRGRRLDGSRRAFVPGLLSILVALVVLLGSTGCAGSGASAGELTVAGSTTVMPIAEIAAEQFAEHTGIHVLVSGLGSSAGIESVLNGTADIATSSRDLTEAEKSTGELVTTEIATDGIAVIVNTQNPVANVTMDQLRAIYAGQITNWKELGGEDLPILVVNRDEASGTREAFKTIVMGDTRFDPAAAVLPGTGQVRDVVSRTPGAIGYISLGFVDSAFTSAKVKALAVNSVEPSEAAVEAGAYPVSRYLYFFTKGEPSGTAKEYIALVVSDEMAQTIRDAGYIPISAERKGGE